MRRVDKYSPAALERVRAAGRDYMKGPVARGRRRQLATGVSPEMYAELMAFQEGRCAICGCDLMKGRVAADHCHDTKKPRGLLCLACNAAEGMIKKTGLDPVEFGRSLAAYLANPPADVVALTVTEAKK